jgi:hypothetical protein
LADAKTCKGGDAIIMKKYTEEEFNSQKSICPFCHHDYNLGVLRCGPAVFSDGGVYDFHLCKFDECPFVYHWNKMCETK